jgi:hypothetical protein
MIFWGKLDSGRWPGGGRGATGRGRGTVDSHARFPRRGTGGDVAAQEGFDGGDIFEHRCADSGRGCIAIACGAGGLGAARSGRRGHRGEAWREGRLCSPVASKLRLEVVLGISVDGHPPRLVQLSCMGLSACAEGYHGLAVCAVARLLGSAVLTGCC